jgi:isoprenylcysteine carboxyl methyltransferase (ICMT) family protein YpbQ
MKVVLFILVIFFNSLTSLACTLCNSRQAADVRALVFGNDFYKNLFFSILPFVVFTVIIVIISRNNKSHKHNEQ